MISERPRPGAIVTTRVDDLSRRSGVHVKLGPLPDSSRSWRDNSPKEYKYKTLYLGKSYNTPGIENISPGTKVMFKMTGFNSTTLLAVVGEIRVITVDYLDNSGNGVCEFEEYTIKIGNVGKIGCKIPVEFTDIINRQVNAEPLFSEGDQLKADISYIDKNGRGIAKLSSVEGIDAWGVEHELRIHDVVGPNNNVSLQIVKFTSGHTVGQRIYREKERLRVLVRAVTNENTAITSLSNKDFIVERVLTDQEAVNAKIREINQDSILSEQIFDVGNRLTINKADISDVGTVEIPLDETYELRVSNVQQLDTNVECTITELHENTIFCKAHEPRVRFFYKSNEELSEEVISNSTKGVRNSLRQEIFHLKREGSEQEKDYCKAKFASLDALIAESQSEFDKASEIYLDIYTNHGLKFYRMKSDICLVKQHIISGRIEESYDLLYNSIEDFDRPNLSEANQLAALLIALTGRSEDQARHHLQSAETFYNGYAESPAEFQLKVNYRPAVETVFHLRRNRKTIRDERIIELISWTVAKSIVPLSEYGEYTIKNIDINKINTEESVAPRHDAMMANNFSQKEVARDTGNHQKRQNTHSSNRKEICHEPGQKPLLPEDIGSGVADKHTADDRRMTADRFYGGVNGRLEMLQQMLEYIDSSSPTEDDLIDWILSNTRAQSDEAVVHHLNFIKTTELILYSDDCYSLTNRGKQYSLEEDSFILYQALQSGVKGFETILRAMQEGSMTDEEIMNLLLSEFEECNMTTPGVAARHREWLEALGFVQGTDEGYALTDDGQTVLDPSTHKREYVEKPESEPSHDILHREDASQSRGADVNPEVLQELRSEAEEVATDDPSRDGVTSTASKYIRSPAIKKYAKARAGGLCEWCEEPASFQSKTGGPYLEIHHVEELGQGGSDSPEKVVALCPICHAHVHYGEGGDELNAQIQRKLETELVPDE